ncbi:MAG TPA: hypothetical protein VGO62_22280, partial [Myxococcota bacterium]
RQIHAALLRAGEGRETFLVEAGRAAASGAQRRAFTRALLRVVVEVEQSCVARCDLDGVARALSGAAHVCPDAPTRAVLEHLVKALRALHASGARRGVAFAYQVTAAANDAASEDLRAPSAALVRLFGAALGVAAVSSDDIAAAAAAAADDGNDGNDGNDGGLADVAGVIVDAAGFHATAFGAALLEHIPAVVGHSASAAELMRSIMDSQHGE